MIQNVWACYALSQSEVADSLSKPDCPPLYTCPVDILSNMVSCVIFFLSVACFLKKCQQSHMMIIQSFRIFNYATSVFLNIPWMAVVPPCTHIHVWVEIDLVCNLNEIDGSLRDIGMKMDTCFNMDRPIASFFSENTYCPISKITISLTVLKYCHSNLRYSPKYLKSVSCFPTFLFEGCALSKRKLFEKMR